jgi:hypothetical protein
MEDNYDAFTASKTDNLAGALKVAGIPYKNPYLGSKVGSVCDYCVHRRCGGAFP